MGASRQNAEGKDAQDKEAQNRGAPDEAAVFGLSGGIGFHYVVLGDQVGARVYLDGRSRGLSASGDGVVACAQAFGVPVVTRDPASEMEAENALVDGLESGKQVLVWTDLASMTHHRLPRGYAGAIPRLVGVLRFDESAEEFELDDGAERAIPIDAARLRLARSEVEGARNRMYCLGRATPDRATQNPALDQACMVQLRETLRRHSTAPIGNRGVAGIRTLATRLRESRHRSSWEASFRPCSSLYHALASLYRWIDHGSAGASLGRRLWAGHLGAMALQPGCSWLGDEVEGWSDIATRWSNLAESALPRDVRRLAEARQLMEAKYLRYRQDGLEAASTIAATNARLGAIAAEMDSDFPLAPGSTRELLDDLATRLDDLATLELAACERLSALTS
jgi:hypothetical protein